MYDSNSFIKQSIYQSQAVRIPPSQPQIILKQTKPQPSLQSQKLDDNKYLKIYEQNIQLKDRQVDLLKEIKELKERLYKKDQNSKISLEQELKVLAQGKKNAWDTLKAPISKKSSSRGFSGSKGGNSNKTQHLLEIIDHYKQKLVTAEEELTNLRRQKALLQQDLRMKDKKVDQLRQQRGQNSIEAQVDLAQRLRRSIRQLQLQKQRGKSLQLAIKSLQAKLRSQQLKSQQIDNLKIQNRSLQQKIMRLTNLPDFNNIIDKGQQQRKGKQLQNKLKLLNEKYNLIRDNTIKTQAQLKLTQNKLIQVTSQLNGLQKQNILLRQQSINDPIILKLMKSPQLVQKIIFQIQQQKQKDKNTLGVYDSKNKIEKLILQKEQLGKIVLNYQSKLKIMDETHKQRQKIQRLQKQQSIIAINQPSKGVSSKQGVIYDGDINIFTQQPTTIPQGYNYFDLFLGEINLLETMVLSITGLSNPSSPLLLATVDFYNHNTQHSKLTQGCRCDLQSQFSFRVNQDDFFIKYLQKGNFQVDIWASQGSKNYHLGRGTIQLKYLVSRARARISPIISTSIPLYLNQKVMGSLNLSMRLRLPIYDQLQHIKQTSLQSQIQSQIIVRKLIIQINQGRGFGDKSNTFVYYPFRLQDHYSKTSKGNNPLWNYLKLLEINYDNDFKNYLRKNQLEFTIFDDSVLVIDEKNSDVVGNAFLSLLPLLEGKVIKERLEVRKGNQRRGTIDVKIYWHQPEGGDGDGQKKMEEERKMGVEGVHEEIRSFMKEHSVDSQKVFRMIDWNRTGNVSYEQFQEWIRKVAVRKFSKETLNKYYKSFKQPLNVHNFVAKVSKEHAEDGIREQPIVAGIGMINQLLKKNSTQMKRMSLSEFLSGKNIVEVGRELDTDRLGFISREKLQEYLDKFGIQAQIPTERVKLLDFLKKNQNKMSLTL